MRVSILLAIPLALCALPAAANGPMRTGGSPNHHFAVMHRFPPLHEVVRLHGRVVFPRFSRWAGGYGNGFGGGYGYYGLGGYDLGGYIDGAGASAPGQAVIAMAPPPRSPGDDRPTVETTTSGVTIIRGPGSHHR
jgi:hypothetical protein